MAYIGAKPINVANGGTGAQTFTLNGILVGNGTSAVTATTAGTTAQMLRGNTGSSPTFSGVCPGSFSFAAANVGGATSLSVQNLDNTNTASSSLYNILTGGSASGDTAVQYSVPGVTTWTQGIDNSVTTPENDPYVIAASNALGTTNTLVINGTGTVNFPIQSCFLAYLASTVSDVTGNGASFTLGTSTALTKVFDQHTDLNTNGTYTCPITSKVDLRCAITVTGTTTATTFTLSIVTTNRTYQNTFTRTALAANQTLYLSTIADMTAADTATCTIVVSGESGNTDDILGSATLGTYFCGEIVA